MSGRLDLTELEKLKTLVRDTEKLETVIDKFKAHTSNQEVDKYDIGFDVTRSFTVFSLRADFSCYSGYYGNSSVSNFINVSSKDEIQKAFTKYLNKNLDSVINGIVHELKAEAASRITDAEETILSLQELVDSIKTKVDDD